MTAFLGIGSNTGDRLLHIEKALELLQQEAGRIVKISNIYETEPWGFQSENSFINLVLTIETSLVPVELLRICKQIEKKAGRKKTAASGYQNRPLDIDILFYENRILKTAALTIPHPLIQERLFVLQPLCDIAPDFVHPQLHEKMSVLLEKCRDKSWVRPSEFVIRK